VPLIAKEEVLGVLSFYTTERYRLTSEEVEFLTTLVGQAAIAIHDAQLAEQIQRQSTGFEDTKKPVKDNVVTLPSPTKRDPKFPRMTS